MKVAVVFKWARDPRDARISVDGELVWGNAKMAASDDDPAAIQVALALAEGEDVVAITVGDGDNAWAAARDAASTVIVEDVADGVDASFTAGAIAQAIGAAGGADAIVIGDSDWNTGVPVALMAKMGMPSFAGITAAEPVGDGSYLLSCKEGSVTKVIQARPPFVISVRGLTSEKTVPGMKQVLMARKKPQTKLQVADCPECTQRIQAGAVRPPEEGTAVIIEESDSNRAAQMLVDALQREGVL